MKFCIKYAGGGKSRWTFGRRIYDYTREGRLGKETRRRRRKICIVIFDDKNCENEEPEAL